MNLDDLPNAARRALAARSMLAIHGFSDDQVFIGLGVQIAGFPVVEGTVHLALVISKDGDPSRSCDFLWPVGPIDLAWWDQYGPPVLVETWNTLSAAQRLRERNRWISPEDEIRLGDALRCVGLLPPSRDGIIN